MTCVARWPCAWSGDDTQNWVSILCRNLCNREDQRQAQGMHATSLSHTPVTDDAVSPPDSKVSLTVPLHVMPCMPSPSYSRARCVIPSPSANLAEKTPWKGMLVVTALRVTPVMKRSTIKYSVDWALTLCQKLSECFTRFTHWTLPTASWCRCYWPPGQMRTPRHREAN